MQILCVGSPLYTPKFPHWPFPTNLCPHEIKKKQLWERNKGVCQHMPAFLRFTKISGKGKLSRYIWESIYWGFCKDLKIKENMTPWHTRNDFFGLRLLVSTWISLLPMLFAQEDKTVCLYWTLLLLLLLLQKFLAEKFIWNNTQLSWAKH